MRRFLRQSGSLGLALLFAASLASSAFGWHGCPHHAHGPERGHGDTTAPAGAEAPRAVADAAGGHDAGPHPGERARTCTCLGSCHAGAAPVLASSSGLSVADDGAARARPSRPSDRRIRHRRPAYFLPFPHGPPALG